MHKNQKGFGLAGIGLIMVVLGVLGLVGWFVLGSESTDSPKSSVATDIAPLSSEQKKAKDTQKWDRHYGIHGLLLAYQINVGSYPKSTADGWSGFLTATTNKESLTDPYTSTVYTFTNKEPDYGEIEYRFPASCDYERKEIVEPSTSKSYAFRLKYSDGIRCSHNI